MRGRPPTGHGAGMDLRTVPNLITAIRTIAAVILATYAIARPGAVATTAAFLTYWVGDVLDGFVARRLNQETRVGAVADIVADRACTALCAAALLVLRPEAWLPLAIFLLQFMVIDCMLSLSFLRWPVLGPNYFGTVHRGVYRWNWSPPAKSVNTAGVVALILVSPSPVWPAVFAALIAVLKGFSLWTVSRLPAAPA